MNTLVRLHFTLIITKVLNTLEKDPTLTFINVYCGKEIYDILNSHEYVLNDDRKIYFKLDTNKQPTDAGLELETEKNLDKWDDVFE